MSKFPTIRAASSSDIPAIYEIAKHYILNTVITFKTEVTTEQAHLETLQSIQNQRLPYIVAVSDSKDIIGYTYVSGFRSGKAGYKHTVELSLFCHPDHLYQGIGTELLLKLLEILSHPENNLDFLPSGPREEERKVRQVIACMSVNPEGKGGGIGLQKWYEGFGFVLKGHLSEVGYKFDRWLDTMYLQKTLW